MHGNQSCVWIYCIYVLIYVNTYTRDNKLDNFSFPEATLKALREGLRDLGTHGIRGRASNWYLPKHRGGMMEKSLWYNGYCILKNHPFNITWPRNFDQQLRGLWKISLFVVVCGRPGKKWATQDWQILLARIYTHLNIDSNTHAHTHIYSCHQVSLRFFWSHECFY